MKKIYITALHLSHGGVENVICNLSNALTRRGFAVEILCSYNLGAPVYELDPAVKVTYLTDARPNRAELKSALRSFSFAAIIREGLAAARTLRLKKSTMAAALAAIDSGAVISTRNEHSVLLSRCGRPGVLKIAQLHHDHRFDKKLLRDFRRRYGNIDYFALLTAQLRDEVAAIMAPHNQHTKVICVPNFLADCRGPRAEKQPRMLSVGRLSPEKGFDRLLDAWALIVASCPELRLDIVGDGVCRGELETQAARLGIENSVTFYGMLPHGEALNMMSRSLAYLMASRSEGLPLVVIESMSCATVPVAYDVRVGPRAIISDARDGFLVRDGDAATFAAAAVKLARDEKMRGEMERSAAETALRYSEDAVMQQWLSLLSEVKDGQ